MNALIASAVVPALLTIGLLAGKTPTTKIDPTVYITKTTNVYHREDCTIGARKLPVLLSDVKKTYKPCKVCKPPKKALKAPAVPPAPEKPAQP